MSVLEQIPDSLKVTAATTPTALSLWGVPVEQWMFIASAIVSVMFMIEKAPVCIKNILTFVRWIKKLKPLKENNGKDCIR